VKAIVGGEGDVSGSRHDDVGHDAALEATHAIGQHNRRNTADGLKAFRCV
jgi:hypothetical protein